MKQMQKEQAMLLEMTRKRRYGMPHWHGLATMTRANARARVTRSVFSGILALSHPTELIVCVPCSFDIQEKVF